MGGGDFGSLGQPLLNPRFRVLAFNPSQGLYPFGTNSVPRNDDFKLQGLSR